MRRSIRTLFVCMLIALMVYQPAVACHSCGGWSRGYSSGPVYYGSGSYGGCCGSSYWTPVDTCDSCGSCGDCGQCNNGDDGPYTGEQGTSDSDGMTAPRAPADLGPPTARDVAPTEGAVEARPESTTAPQLPPSGPATAPAEPPRATETPTGLFGPESGRTTAPPEAAPPAATAPPQNTPPAPTPPAPTTPPAATSLPPTTPPPAP